MNLTILSGTANGLLADAVAGHLNIPAGRRNIQRFPDGEISVQVLDNVRRAEVYLIQPTGPPVESNLLELLLLADACRRAGAARLVAVIPYFGYARQDRRSRENEAVGARVVAGLIEASGIQQVIAIDLHAAAIEGFFTPPLDHLSAVPILIEAIKSDRRDHGVVVAPDLGAVKLAERYGGALELPVAIVHKTRISGEEVVARRVIGDVQGRAPVIVDDMISTGGTIVAAAEAVMAAGGLPDITGVASHGLFAGNAAERLGRVPVRRYIITDSLARAEAAPAPLERVSVAPLLAEAIRCLHEGQPIGHLGARV